MTTFYPALSTFEVMAAETPAIGCLGLFGHEIVGVGAAPEHEPESDDIELRVAPAGVSVRGRYWREGRYLKATVHIQAAGAAPQTVTLQVDLRRIGQALKRWHARQHGGSSARIGGWPGSFLKSVKKIGKSQLVSKVANAVKSVAKSKLTGAALGATAVVFPPVGVPAAAAYATANAAISAVEQAKDVKNQARRVLATGTAQEKALLNMRAGDIAATLRQADVARNNLREIARRAQQGDFAAKKTARIFSHVMAHRNRVEQFAKKASGQQPTPGVLVTELGKIVPGTWLLAKAEQVGLPAQLLAARPSPVARVPAPRVRARQLPRKVKR
ncbi:MAG: hypothetical protein ACOY0T_20325 [Myxococcota bacterium]